MPPTRNLALTVLLVQVLWGAALPAFADDACLDFKWDVRKERALFAETPAASAAGRTEASAPVVVPNRLYSLRLVAQDQVAFLVPPAGKMRATPAYAGLATLNIAVAGSYRIALDLPSWIDVVSHGALLRASDYQGQHSCGAPHKIVQFDLIGGQAFVLQFSGAATDTILLTITATPARKL
jgi:hypothetical protein